MSDVQWTGLVFVILGVVWLAWAWLRARERAMWDQMAADLRRREVEEERKRRGR